MGDPKPPTAEERADSLFNADCKHNISNIDAQLHPTAADCPACIEDEIKQAEAAAREPLLDRIAQLEGEKTMRINAEREVERLKVLLLDWAHAAGFGLDSGEETLEEIVRTMRNEHCAERSMADLHASGGLPEAMEAACKQARAAGIREGLERENAELREEVERLNAAPYAGSVMPVVEAARAEGRREAIDQAYSIAYNNRETPPEVALEIAALDDTPQGEEE
jgi:hypothetical protein